MGEREMGGRLRIWARDYSDWDLSGEPVPDAFSPANAKAFDGDVVAPDCTVHRCSSFRSSKQFSGVLAVTGATYGRHDRRRFLYRCVPADARLPVFLVAYDAHRRQTDGMTVGRVANVYVRFRFLSWRETHPRGELLEVIGPTSSFEAYCEYQVAVSGTRTDTSPLNRTWRKLQGAHSWLRGPGDAPVRHVASLCAGTEDRTDHCPISIDPVGSADFDDALGYRVESGDRIVSVYIANVPAWLSVLGYWDALPTMSATMYLPTKKYPMFPKALGDGLFSLIADAERLALAMDVVVGEDGVVGAVSFVPCLIRVATNHQYDTDTLQTDVNYKDLLECTKSANASASYVEAIHDSHDVVEYWMLFMNHAIGRRLAAADVGILRCMPKQSPIDQAAPAPSPVASQVVRDMVAGWSAGGARYARSSKNTGHSLVAGGLDAYAHATSPIRRVVDVVNLTRLQLLLGAGLAAPTDAAAAVSAIEMDEALAILNDRMSSIRRAEARCRLLQEAGRLSSDRTVEGVVVGCRKDDSADTYEVAVYLPELRSVGHTRQGSPRARYRRGAYRVVVFEDEAALHRKVRLVLEHDLSD